MLLLGLVLDQVLVFGQSIFAFLLFFTLLNIVGLLHDQFGVRILGLTTLFVFRLFILIEVDILLHVIDFNFGGALRRLDLLVELDELSGWRSHSVEEGAAGPVLWLLLFFVVLFLDLTKRWLDSYLVTCLHFVDHGFCGRWNQWCLGLAWSQSCVHGIHLIGWVCCIVTQFSGSRLGFEVLFASVPLRLGDDIHFLVEGLLFFKFALIFIGSVSNSINVVTGEFIRHLSQLVGGIPLQIRSRSILLLQRSVHVSFGSRLGSTVIILAFSMELFLALLLDRDNFLFGLFFLQLFRLFLVLLCLFYRWDSVNIFADLELLGDCWHGDRGGLDLLWLLLDGVAGLFCQFLLVLVFLFVALVLIMVLKSHLLFQLFFGLVLL